MEITYFGLASFKIRGKKLILVTDPFNPQTTGLSFPKTEADIVTISHFHHDHSYTSLINGSPKIFSGPGEYEVKGVKILGISTFHDNEQGAIRGKNTVYQIKFEGLNLAHLGDLGQKLTTEQIELLNGIDILMIPVGGIYTLDGKEAASLVAQLEPRIVIPMHYKIKNLTFELETLDKFLKEMGKEKIIPQEKLVISKEKLPEELEIVVLQ